MKATVGRIVHYFPISDHGAQSNHADVVPAIVVSIHGENLCNLRVFVDGNENPLWRTSVCQKSQADENQPYWDWPQIEK